MGKSATSTMVKVNGKNSDQFPKPEATRQRRTLPDGKARAQRSAFFMRSSKRRSTISINFSIFKLRQQAGVGTVLISPSDTDHGFPVMLKCSCSVYDSKIRRLVEVRSGAVY